MRPALVLILLTTSCGIAFSSGDESTTSGSGGHDPTSTSSGAGATGGTGGQTDPGGFGGSPASGGAGGTDGGGGSGPALPCHPPGLVDDFDGTEPSAIWNVQGASETITLSGGQLHITPDPANPAWAGLVSGSYDFDECAVWIRVPVVYSGATTGYTYFQLVGAESLKFEARNGNLELKHLDTQVAMPYDAVAHRWWRIREQGSMVHLETSPDGLTWATHLSVPTPSGITSMQLGLGLVPGTNPSGALETQFDDLDVAP